MGDGDLFGWFLAACCTVCGLSLFAMLWTTEVLAIIHVPLIGWLLLPLVAAFTLLMTALVWTEVING